MKVGAHENGPVKVRAAKADTTWVGRAEGYRMMKRTSLAGAHGESRDTVFGLWSETTVGCLAPTRRSAPYTTPVPASPAANAGADFGRCGAGIVACGMRALFHSGARL
jgi:hypothetical protein